VRGLRHEPVVPVSGGALPELSTTEPWDGQDADVALDEEMSLDDIMGGDDADTAAEL
jgi:hypothetical protein